MQTLRSKIAEGTFGNLKFSNEVKKGDSNYNYVIPNNGNKYFLFITKQENSSDSLVLYFFGKDDDFCLEISYNELLLNILFEGYLYEEDGKFVYQVSDILYKDTGSLTQNLTFSKRYMLLCDILYSPIVQSVIYKNLNTTFTLDIANFFYKNDDYQSLLTFNKFYRYFSSYEFIDDKSGNKYTEKLNKISLTKNLIIKKGEKTEIYNVYDPENLNFLGILYVPSLKISKYLKRKFIGDGDVIEISHICTFNYKFNKWELTTPIL